MRFQPMVSPPWICVVRPLLVPDTQLIVMNAYYGPDPEAGKADYTVRLRNGKGRVLAERRMPPIPPRGCVRLPITDAFPDLMEHARREAALSVEVQGSNIMGPFTWVNGPGGDFNLHHFC